jgi:hypothetical protein
LTSPFPDLVPDTPAAPTASTQTKVGFTIDFFGGVAAIVFLLELAGSRMLLGKKVIFQTAFLSKNVKGGWSDMEPYQFLRGPT